MKRAILICVALTGLAALAEGLVLMRVSIDPWRLAALLENLALLLGVFVGLSHSATVKLLRHWAQKSAWLAVAIPFLLLIPYLIYALGTHTFSLIALGKLCAYIAVPTVLLLPDRLHHAERVGWRDLAAMLALGLPVAANWLDGIWTWPQELYLFRPLFCVCVGGYAFMAVRNLDGVGYRLLWRKADVTDGLANLAAFALIGIPLGIALGFLHPHAGEATVGKFLLQFVGVYLTVAIPEEFLFRGILQNFLVRSIHRGPRGLYGLLIASLVFGLSHLHHAPVPNWRYAVLATLAGIFYGNAYRTRRRLSSCALTHALVDTLWHFWF